MNDRISPKVRGCGLLFALVFPSFLTWVYFVALARHSPAVQQSAYTAGKAIQFGFPLIWVLVVLREKLCWRRPGRRGMGAAIGFGVFVLAAMLVLYHGVMQPAGYFDGPDAEIRDKIEGLGLDSLWKYIALGVFYSLCHSLLEEYYWRWFVFGRLRKRLSLSASVGVSSLGFMAHHVILLGIYFGWTSAATVFFSLAVAFGGAVWALIYERSETLYAPWLSHLLVDAGIFIIGFDLARDLLI